MLFESFALIHYLVLAYVLKEYLTSSHCSFAVQMYMTKSLWDAIIISFTSVTTEHKYQIKQFELWFMKLKSLLKTNPIHISSRLV